MLSVPVQKDIGEYEQKIVVGLTLRTLCCLGVGGCIAAAIVFAGHFGAHISFSDLGAPVMLVMLAAFVFGYYRPLGMRPEQAFTYLKRQYLRKGKLHYVSAAAAPRGKEHDVSKESRRARDEFADLVDDASERGCAEWIVSRYFSADDAGAAQGGRLGAEGAQARG